MGYTDPCNYSDPGEAAFCPPGSAGFTTICSSGRVYGIDCY
jgi:hypothetical protein